MSEIENEGDRLAGMGNDAASREGRPPRVLVASDRVEGTTVYNRGGERIGVVRRFQVDKLSGQACYAEMEFGGFLGIGKETYPLPWDMLDYDVDVGGYVVDLTREQLSDAPCYAETERREIDDSYGADIRKYYGLGLLP